MIRAMLRDISQGLSKLKAKQNSDPAATPPKWLKNFVEHVEPETLDAD